MTALVVPEALLADVGAFFETCGARGCEGTAMIKNGHGGPVLVIPEQQPRRSSSGGVSVESPAPARYSLRSRSARTTCTSPGSTRTRWTRTIRTLTTPTRS